MADDPTYDGLDLEKLLGFTKLLAFFMQNSRNIAFEAYLIMPESYLGMSCMAFQKRENLGNRSPRQERYSESLADQQLKFRCATGRPNISLAGFHIKVRWEGKERFLVDECNSIRRKYSLSLA